MFWFLVGPFGYFHTSCVRTAKALVRLRRYAGRPEPSLVACVISTMISSAGSNESKVLYCFRIFIRFCLVTTQFRCDSEMLQLFNVQPPYMYNFNGRTLRLLPYFMCANSEGSGETAQIRRQAWAFAGRLCDKYHDLISWLKWEQSTVLFSYIY